MTDKVLSTPPHIEPVVFTRVRPGQSLLKHAASYAT